MMNGSSDYSQTMSNVKRRLIQGQLDIFQSQPDPIARSSLSSPKSFTLVEDFNATPRSNQINTPMQPPFQVVGPSRSLELSDDDADEIDGNNARGSVNKSTERHINGNSSNALLVDCVDWVNAHAANESMELRVHVGVEASPGRAICHAGSSSRVPFASGRRLDAIPADDELALSTEDSNDDGEGERGGTAPVTQHASTDTPRISRSAVENILTEVYDALQIGSESCDVAVPQPSHIPINTPERDKENFTKPRMPITKEKKRVAVPVKSRFMTASNERKQKREEATMDDHSLSSSANSSLASSLGGGKSFGGATALPLKKQLARSASLRLRGTQKSVHLPTANECPAFKRPMLTMKTGLGTRAKTEKVDGATRTHREVLKRSQLPSGNLRTPLDSATVTPRQSNWTQKELDLLHARYVQWMFLNSASTHLEERQQKQFSAEYSSLAEANSDLKRKVGGLHKELAYWKHIHFLEEAIDTQLSSLEPLLTKLPSFKQHFMAVAHAVDSHRHRLPTEGIWIPTREGETGTWQWENELVATATHVDQLASEVMQRGASCCGRNEELQRTLGSLVNTVCDETSGMHQLRQTVEHSGSVFAKEASVRVQRLQEKRFGQGGRVGFEE